jgi:hypothetical protein
MKVAVCMAAILLAAVLLTAADGPALAGVTITEVKPDLTNKTISFTVTNGTDQLVTALAFNIRSIYGADSQVAHYAVDVSSADVGSEHGPLAPGLSRTFTTNLDQVRLKTLAADLPADIKRDPAAADVTMNMVVFGNNRAYGDEREIANIEEIRAHALRTALADLAAIANARKAADARAYVADLLAAAPPPEPVPQGEQRAPSRNEAYRRAEQQQLYDTITQMQRLLDNPPPGKTVSQVLDFLAQWPKTASEHLTGHTKLIRATAE